MSGAPILRRTPAVSSSSSASTSPASSSAPMIPSISNPNVPVGPGRVRRGPRRTEAAGGDEDEILPPHEISARESAKGSPITAFSVVEDAGRRLKGRELRLWRVRNVLWGKTGSMDLVCWLIDASRKAEPVSRYNFYASREAEPGYLDEFISRYNLYIHCQCLRRKRKKMEKSVEEIIFEIVERSTATMIAQMDKTADKISKAIQDGEVQDMRGKLNSELAKVVGLTRAERLRALTKIACDRAITTIFFTLEDEDKEEWVRSIID